MTHVLDASAVVDLLVRSEVGERIGGLLLEWGARLVSVAHLDAEVLSALARLQRAGELTADEVDGLLGRLSELPMPRLPIGRALLDAAWGLRANVAARDALYVAAARGLAATLVTTDDRLARAVPDLALPLG